MKDVLTSQKLHLEIRKCLVRCYVLSIFLYASESWTQNNPMEDKIKFFDMWIFRRMFKISHLDRKTNLEVLEMAKVKQALLRTIQERKLQYFLFKDGTHSNNKFPNFIICDHVFSRDTK